MRRTVWLVLLMAAVTACEHGTEPKFQVQMDGSPAYASPACLPTVAAFDGNLGGTTFQVVRQSYNIPEEGFIGSPLNCFTNLRSVVRGVGDTVTVTAYHTYPFASTEVYHWTDSGGYVSFGCDGCFEEGVRFTSWAPDPGFIGGHYTARAYGFSESTGGVSATLQPLTPDVCMLSSLTSPATVTFLSAGECTLQASHSADPYGGEGPTYSAQQVFRVIAPLTADLEDGTGVVVTPSNPDDPDEPAPVTLVFDEVTTAGTVTVTSTTEWPESQSDPPGNFLLGNPPRYYDIHTDGVVFEGLVQVCLTYDPLEFQDTSPPVLLHYDEVLDVWEPLQDQTQPDSTTVCGWTSSFSYFAVAQPASVSVDDEMDKGKAKAKGKGKGA
jgi:hypothetical protein